MRRIKRINLALLTQFMTFFVSPFSEPSSHAELNNFLKSHRIINVEKRLIDGERGTGWVFLVEYSDNEGSKTNYTMSAKIDWRDVLNPTQFAVYDLLRKKRKEIGDKTKIPLYGIFSNEQLALMAQTLPKTKDEFIKIDTKSTKRHRLSTSSISINEIESIILKYCLMRNIPGPDGFPSESNPSFIEAIWFIQTL